MVGDWYTTSIIGTTRYRSTNMDLRIGLQILEETSKITVNI